MKLRDIGEDRLVAELVRRLPISSHVQVPAGDDCAVLGGARDSHWRLLKTDAVIEGVHFRSDEKPDRIGRKALCRTLSDIAAMAGTPEAAVVTLAISERQTVGWVRKLYSGLRRAALRFEVSIVGGETCRSPGPVFINIAMTGCVKRSRCILRSGGRQGDAIYVTGRLGGSLAGKHLTFTPRIAEARWLAAEFPIHAMMDLSDGLGSDLPRLAEASNCGFEIWPERIPRTRGCSLAQAIQDGEDFELLFALPSTQGERLERAWTKQFHRLPLTRIGTLTRRTSKQTGFPRGYDHFA